jgi:hypothetical protein
MLRRLAAEIGISRILLLLSTSFTGINHPAYAHIRRYAQVEAEGLF